MSKVLEASCAAGIVTADGFPVLGVTILSEGVGPSSGILIMSGDETFYVAKTSPDLKSTLGPVIDSITEIASALTAIAAGMLGPATAPPPTIPTSVTTLTAKVATLTALKELLK